MFVIIRIIYKPENRSQRRLIVAPVLNQGDTTKTVVLPEGKWQDANGTEYQGGQTITVDAPINTLPIFEKMD